jgi:hypothetical protein
MGWDRRRESGGGGELHKIKEKKNLGILTDITFVS